MKPERSRSMATPFRTCSLVCQAFLLRVTFSAAVISSRSRARVNPLRQLPLQQLASYCPSVLSWVLWARMDFVYFRDTRTFFRPSSCTCCRASFRGWMLWSSLTFPAPLLYFLLSASSFVCVLLSAKVQFQQWDLWESFLCLDGSSWTFFLL